jgi:hypothetical protein
MFLGRRFSTELRPGVYFPLFSSQAAFEVDSWRRTPNHLSTQVDAVAHLKVQLMRGQVVAATCTTSSMMG